MDADEKTFDNDTLPARSTIRKKLKQIHAHSLSLIADRIINSNEDGSTLTHATNSTTRTSVGSFALAGVHINRDEYLIADTTAELFNRKTPAGQVFCNSHTALGFD